jgi:uncharacterized protein YjeT (DUF2065 family)
MRFVGLVLVLVGLAVGYFLGYLGMTIDQARARLALLLNLPGLAPPATPTVHKTMTRGSNNNSTTSGVPSTGNMA